MKVLSLFNGISCGRVAFKKAEIPVTEYVSYEIEKHANAIAKYNYPNDTYLGDVSAADFLQYKGFDWVIGGSPCQDLSNYKYDRGDVKGLEGSKSNLFYHFVRAIKEVQPKYFLLENVASMENKWKDVISSELGVEPIMINSALVCAAERKRLYWVGILQDNGTYKTAEIEQPINCFKIILDILLPEVSVDKKYWYNEKKYNWTVHEGNVKVKATLHLKGHRQMKEVYNFNHKCNTLACDGNGGNLVKKVFQDNRVRKFTPLEYERFQTLPNRYTLYGDYDGKYKQVADSNRYTAIGNGWTVDVISHILKETLKG